MCFAPHHTAVRSAMLYSHLADSHFCLHEPCMAAQLTRHSSFPFRLLECRRYYFPPEFNVDYGEPVGGALCKETAANSEIFTREYSKASVQLDCKAWKGTITMKN